MADLTPQVSYVAAAGIGLVVGVFFFGTLWLTVRGLATARRPRLLLAGSFILRAAVVLGVFYALADGGPAAVLVAVAAFIVSRSLLVRNLASKPEERAVR